MIYGITSYIRTLLIVGVLALLVYIGHINLFEKSFNEDLNELYTLLAVCSMIVTIHYALNWKYIIMPYSLNLHGMFSHNTFTETRSIKTLFLDFFWDKKKIKLRRLFVDDIKTFALEYTNLISINLDNYRKAKERMLHYLGLIQEGYEVSIYPKKSKTVELVFYKLPNFYEIDFGFFRVGRLFLGKYERGLYYRNFDTIDHHLVVGESGSGKSNYMHLLNINFFFNQDSIKKMYMVDLKGGVELNAYSNIENVEFVNNIERLDTLLDDIVEDMQKTQEYMLKNNIRKNDIFTLIIFDEVGAVSVYPDKKIRDSILNKLALISMQGRSSGHIMFLFAQKIDATILPIQITNNIQSRVLLKTTSDNNISIIDLKENIRDRITSTEIQDFNKGRAIYKNGLTSEKNLVQFPFISDNFLDMTIRNFSKK
ncbi:MAG: hypothetical protein A2345_00225 [Sulfurimonas sp. RIFOXYB12_FULL_35_9]|nr:MAG: hypothetical protein A2345_00225 [Sulfurimonas sp. RIFOXYB12_FULL_35_9]